MGKSKSFSTVNYRRKSKARTNYRKRMLMLKSGTIRLVIRKSLSNIYAQVVKYEMEGDKVIAGCSSRELLKYGWDLPRDNLPAAYLTGLIIGKKALKHNIKKVIPDLGFQRSTKGSRIYAVVKGALEAGLAISVKDDILPEDGRISGAHIAEYAGQLKKDTLKYERQFSAYLKKKKDPESIKKSFDEAKAKIIGEK